MSQHIVAVESDPFGIWDSTHQEDAEMREVITAAAGL